ncbi:MAG: alginate lyase family protein [Syntrophaceae bacterium]|nr:alginate lyase family protein [Syntrophaceae bacterium]
MFYPIIKRQIENDISNFIKDENHFKKKLSETIGDFTDFSKYVSEETRCKILIRADEINNGYYEILGSGRVQLRPVNWHQDFKSGHIWPKGKFYLKYEQVDYSNNADVKVPRELSRSHHLLYLGQAYLLTHDEKYAREFTYQIEDWIKENPLMYSINWGCAMDVAIRAVNWIYALNMFIDSPLIDEKIIKKICTSLYEHGYFIFNNLEKMYRNSNNHYFANLSGLIFLGLLLRPTKQGKRWFDFSLLEFYREVRYQFLPSGVHYERSISYNRLMVELSVYPYLILVKNDINVPLDIRHRLSQTFDFILHYMKPNGDAPIIGDQDDGRFIPFGLYRNSDHRYLLTLGAILFNNPRYKKYANNELTDALFLTGNTCAEKFAAVRDIDFEVGSKAFPDAGFCVMRAEDKYMFITNSGAAAYPDQTATWGSHAHPDLLSFELVIGEVTYLVDPGTYLYTSSPKERNLFRSTRMHNTVVVDDQDQHRLPKDNIFCCLDIAEPLEFDFIASSEKDVFTGSHNGYAKLKNPVIHSRKVVFDKKESTWEISDCLSGKGEHLFKWYFHFANGLDFEIDKNRVYTKRQRKINLEITFSADWEKQLKKLDDFVSRSFGTKEPAYTLEISGMGKCPVSAKTLIRII